MNRGELLPLLLRKQSGGRSGIMGRDCQASRSFCSVFSLCPLCPLYPLCPYYGAGHVREPQVEHCACAGMLSSECDALGELYGL